MKNERLKDVIISPPFGNYLKFSWATSVAGTFTLRRRPGIIKQAIKTIRLTDRGWVNRMGLRNKGVENIRSIDNSKIYSVSAISNYFDWTQILMYLSHNNLSAEMVELNISCPNVHPGLEPGISFELAKKYSRAFKVVIAKLPPTIESISLFGKYYWYGIKTFHLCNTVPVDKGGLSGREVKAQSLYIINKIRTLYPHDNYTIIGGGGIYTPQDIVDYRNAGADHFSLSTIWFTPWKVISVVRFINRRQAEKLLTQEPKNIINN